MNEISSSRVVGATASIHTRIKVNPEENKKEADGKSTPNMDKVEIGKSNKDSVTYSNFGISKKLQPEEIEALISQADKATENLRKLVEKLILKQTKEADKIDKTNHTQKPTTAEISKATSLIAEDGEYGVKAVSDRLVNFAISVSGGDKTKLAELTAAIDDGFNAARKAFGGELPEICDKTYDETMRKLKDWANS